MIAVHTAPASASPLKIAETRDAEIMADFTQWTMDAKAFGYSRAQAMHIRNCLVRVRAGLRTRNGKKS